MKILMFLMGRLSLVAAALLLGGGFAASVGLAPPPVPPPHDLAQALDLAPCARPGLPGRVECGTLRVAEDRARPAARTLSLFFVVARATARATDNSARATDDPVFFFTGGPGSAASLSAGALSAQLAPLRTTRDFVFIDQRGTGRSAPLACAFPPGSARHFEPMFDAGHATACRTELEASADLRFYTTSDAALDADDVRRALGYGRINLHGSSYGTRMAWAYAARFPSRARAMLLHGPAPPGFHLPVPFARGLDAAIDGVIAACLAETACAARYPNLRRDVAKVFDQVRAKPARVPILEAGAQPFEALLTHGELAEAVRYQLYTVAGARNLPSLLTRAAAGDYTPIAQASIQNRRRLEQQLFRGMFYAVTCAEDVPFMSEPAIRAASAGTRLGDYRVRQQIAACRTWPRGESGWWRIGSTAASGHASSAGASAGRASAQGASSPSSPSSGAAAPPLQTPTLVLAGEFDPATPPEAARRAMRLLPNGRLVIVPHGAHAFGGLGIDACINRLTAAFLTQGSAKGLDTSCVAAATRPPFNVQ